MVVKVFLLLLLIHLTMGSTYDNNFYVLLSSSKFFFNYRHTGNTLVIYEHLKAMGVSDDRIVLMLPENHACNARNAFPGTLYYEAPERRDWYCRDIEVDYKAEDLTYEAILNIVRGRYERLYPASRKLQANEKTKVFIYMNGHGGENFFKIQDTEVVHSEDFAKVFAEMHTKRLYADALLILDTCEAYSLFDQVESPDIVMVGTSVHGQHALSHHLDGALNTYINDKFTYFFYKFLKEGKNVRLSDFPAIFPFEKVESDLKIKSTHLNRKLD